LTNFPNGKQTQESLESGFPENEFRETNMALTSSFSNVYAVVDDNSNPYQNMVMDTMRMN
jgi:hypothetical protein